MTSQPLQLGWLVPAPQEEVFDGRGLEPHSDLVFDLMKRTLWNGMKEAFLSYVYPIYTAKFWFGAQPIQALKTYQLQKMVKTEVGRSFMSMALRCIPSDYLDRSIPPHQQPFLAPVAQALEDKWMNLVIYQYSWKPLWAARLFAAGMVYQYGFDHWPVLCGALILLDRVIWHSYQTDQAHYVRAEYMARGDVLKAYCDDQVATIKEKVGNRYPVGAFLVGALASVIAGLRMWNRDRKEGLAPQSGALAPSTEPAKPPPVVSDPTPEVDGWQGWKEFLGLRFKADKTRSNATLDQTKTVVLKNLVFLSINAQGSDGVNYSNGLFLKKGLLLVPEHIFFRSLKREDGASVLDICVMRNSSPGGKFVVHNVELAKCYKFPNLDMVMVYVPQCPDMKDISRLFPQTIPKGRGVARIVARNHKELVEETLTVEFRRVMLDWATDGIDGGHYTTKMAVRGFCMSPLICDTKTPAIVGVHIAGNGTGTGACQCVVQSQLAQAEKVLFEKSPCKLPFAEPAELPESVYNTPLVSGPVHPKSAFYFVDGEPHSSCVVDETFPGIVMGSTPVRATQKPAGKKTMLYEDMTQEFGPVDWRPAPIHPQNWRNFNDTLLHFKNPPRNFKESELELAYLDYMSAIEPIMEEVVTSKAAGTGYEWFRPLTLQESIMGVRGCDYMKGLDMATGCGQNLPGKKSKYFTDVVEKGVLVDRVADDRILERVEWLESRWKEGKRAYNVATACLKAEIVNKDKVRVFYVNEVAMSICIRKYFLPLCELMARHRQIFECLVGLNSVGPEWQEMYEAMERMCEQLRLPGDHNKYDIRAMMAQITITSWKTLIDVCEKGGYPMWALRIMRFIVTDVVHPTVDYNGTLVVFTTMNTSGNNMTTLINSIANALLMRMGFGRHYPSELEAKLFRKRVAAAFYGDDFNAAVSGVCRNFNFRTYKLFLGEHNLKITLPSKEDGGGEAPEYLLDKDVDFLKRRSVMNQDIEQVVGALDKASILKPLYMLVPKKETETMCLTESLGDALRESFVYGRDEYERVREKLRRVIAKHPEIPPDVLDKPYDWFVADWVNKYRPRD
jgi:hypothetical protein